MIKGLVYDAVHGAGVQRVRASLAVGLAVDLNSNYCVDVEDLPDRYQESPNDWNADAYLVE
jgi:hypothetical protein